MSSPLYMPANERGFIAGQTRSGKTTLAHYIIQPWPYLLILDPKCQFQPRKPYALARRPEELPRAAKREPWILFRPLPGMDLEGWDRVFEWLYWRRNTACYCDEMAAVIGTTPAVYPPHLQWVYQQGGGLNIGMLAVSQRPFGLPQFILTESEHKWKFFLARPEDQKRMAEYMGDVVLEPKDYPVGQAHSEKHSFYHSWIGDRAPARQYVIRLGRS